MKFLFDLGGVFFDWDPNHFFKNIFEKAEERKYFLTEYALMNGIFSRMQAGLLKTLNLN